MQVSGDLQSFLLDNYSYEAASLKSRVKNKDLKKWAIKCHQLVLKGKKSQVVSKTRKLITKKTQDSWVEVSSVIKCSEMVE